MTNNFQEYFEITNDTLLTIKDNKLSTINILEFFTFLDKYISNLNITKIILNNLFDIEYVDKNSKKDWTILTNYFIDFLKNHIIITCLQIDYLYCYEKRNSWRGDNSNIIYVNNFLRKIPQNTNINEIIIVNFDTDAHFHIDYWDHGHSSSEEYSDANMRMFVGTFNELASNNQINKLKVNNKYYKNQIYSIKEYINSFKETNIELINKYSIFYEKLLEKNIINNIKEYIEKIDLILKTFNLTIQDKNLIFDIIDKYIDNKNKLEIDLNNYIFIINLIIKTFDLTIQDNNLIFNILDKYIDIKNKLELDLNNFILIINNIKTKMNLSINNIDLINEIFNYYITLKNQNIYENVDEFLNEIIDKIKILNLDILTDLSIFIKTFDYILTFKSVNILKLNDTKTFTGLLKIKSKYDNIKIINIEVDELNKELCEALYINCYNETIQTLIINTSTISNIGILYELIKNNKNIKELTFNSIKHLTEEWTEFLTKIIKNTTITNLELLNCNIPISSFKKIYKVLKKNNNLKNITLNLQNIINDLEIYYIFKLLQKNKQINIILPSKIQKELLYNEYLTNENKNRIKFL